MTHQSNVAVATPRQFNTGAALSHDPYIKVQPRVARRFGNDAAMLIATLQSWVDIGRNYSSSRERLAEATNMSVTTLWRIVKNLKSLGVIETQALEESKGLTYFINYQRLYEKTLGESLPVQNETSNVIRLFQNETPPKTQKQVELEGVVQNETVFQNETLCIYNNNIINNNIHSVSKRTTPISERTTKKETKKNNLEERPGSDTTSMGGIWVKHTGPILGARPTAVALEECLKNHFNGSLAEWEAYCKMIAKSKSLMGERGKKDWKAFLGWAIKPESIQDILSGEVYDQDRPLPPPSAQEMEQLAENGKKEISELDAPENIRELRLSLLRVMGGAAYKSWMEDCLIDQIGGHTVDFKPETTFYKDWIKSNYSDHIMSAVGDLFKNVTINGVKI